MLIRFDKSPQDNSGVHSPTGTIVDGLLDLHGGVSLEDLIAVDDSDD